MKSFSIIVCTYNPDFTTFNKLLNSLLNLNNISPIHEVIIVDNNSFPALRENIILQEFLFKKSNARLITETTPGLTAARIAGITSAQYEWLIFFDDDNEPADDYLIVADKIISSENQIAAWGPGVINVVYTSGGDKWLEAEKELFQQRNHLQSVFGFSKETAEYYPDGTGLVLSKGVALKYVEKVENLVYTLTDRKGNSLSSGGDLQMVLTATNCGYGAGRCSGLKLTHNINKQKTSLKYLIKMCFGVETCNYLAHSEACNWDTQKKNSFHYTRFIDLLRVIYNITFIQKISYKSKILNLARFTGQQSGIALLKEEKHPSKLITLITVLINR
jgi:glycosyltransferase involved in cell wall biosynthesis